MNTAMRTDLAPAILALSILLGCGKDAKKKDEAGDVSAAIDFIAKSGADDLGKIKTALAEGKPHDVMLPEGSIYLLPANVPHAPMRGPDTVGLIVERIRKNGMMDTHRWYCEKCNNILYEKTVAIEVLERDMPPVFDAYYGDPENQRCKKCGHVNPGRPAKG